MFLVKKNRRKALIFSGGKKAKKFQLQWIPISNFFSHCEIEIEKNDSLTLWITFAFLSLKRGADLCCSRLVLLTILKLYFYLVYQLSNETVCSIQIVTSSKRRHKNSMKCAIAKFLNQDGRPDRYWKLKRMMENSANHPHPTRERTHRHRSIPEIAVLCYLPRKTSQLPAEPEEWPKR